MLPKPRFLAKGMTLLAITLTLATLMVAVFAFASSHREAPAISQDPAADNTDVYAFVSPDRPNSVTLIGCWWPFEEPGGGPNFYRFDDNARYLMHIDNNGDAKDEVTLVFKFRTEVRDPNTFLYNTGPIDSLDSPNWNIRQFYSVTRISDPGTPNEFTEVLGDNIPVAPANVGPKSTPNYPMLMQQATRHLVDGYNVYAGQADDPFFVDIASLFDLLTIRPGPPGNMGGGKDTIHGYNLQAIALQVPIAFLTKNGRLNTDPKDPNAIIGVWMSTERPSVSTRTPGKETGSDQRVQVSRLGMPLVNELVIPVGLKDAFNGLDPTQDAATLSTPDGRIPIVQDPEIARRLKAIYGIDIPPTPRDDLVTVFLKGVPGLNQPANVQPAEMLRLNTAIMPSSSPNNRLGVLAGDVQGFPNGRRLTDDVVDIELRVAAGVLVDGFNKAPNNQLGDGVDTNDLAFSPVFPYLGVPWPGFDQLTKK